MKLTNDDQWDLRTAFQFYLRASSQCQMLKKVKWTENKHYEILISYNFWCNELNLHTSIPCLSAQGIFLLHFILVQT